MITHKTIIVPLVALPLVLFSAGCANVPKATSLSAGGAIAGAAVGARYGGLPGAVAGAVIGGVIGNQIGSHLDETDKKKLLELELKALETGKPITFITNKDKSKITSTPGPITTDTVRSYSLSSEVEAYQLKLVPLRDINAFSDIPVFNDINEKSQPKMVIKKGEIIHIPAYVEKNNKWGAIVDSDTVIGYIPLRYLKKQAVIAKNKPPKNPKIIAATVPTTSVNGSATSKDSVAAAPKSIESPVRVVKAMGTCRTIERKVDTGNKSDSIMEKVNFCQEPPPKWKVISL